MILRQVLDEETTRGNYCGELRLTYSNSFSGMIQDFVSPRITLEVNLNSPELKSITRAIFRHEINHLHYGNLLGCPRTFENHVEILNSVSEVLASAGYPNIPVSSTHTLYTYMANLFSDFINNSQLGRTTNHIGMWEFYKQNLDEKPISPLFDAFIRLQEYTYGSKYSKKLLRPHHTKDPRVLQAIRDFITDSGFSRDNIDELINSLAYKELSRIFTEKLLPLIDRTKLSDKDYVSQTFIPLEAQLFPSELGNPEVKMGLVWKAYQKSSSDGAFDPPKFLDRKECLRLIYQRLARNLEVIVSASTQSSEIPIIFIGRKSFEPETDAIEKARVTFDGKLILESGRIPFTLPITYQSRPSLLPEIQFALLDTSGSTQRELGSKSSPSVMNPWSPKELQWTDDSIYHYELLSWFGLLEYLRKQGALRQTSVRLANFSNSTLYASNLSLAYDCALSPQFGRTRLTNVSSLFGSPVPKKLIFTLSDGEINNWNSIMEDFVTHAKKHFYFHLQIGSNNSMTSYLQDNNLPVFFDDGRNLGKMIIDLTRPFVSRSAK